MKIIKKHPVLDEVLFELFIACRRNVMTLSSALYIPSACTNQVYIYIYAHCKKVCMKPMHTASILFTLSLTQSAASCDLYFTPLRYIFKARLLVSQFNILFQTYIPFIRSFRYHYFVRCRQFASRQHVPEAIPDPLSAESAQEHRSSVNGGAI